MLFINILITAGTLAQKNSRQLLVLLQVLFKHNPPMHLPQPCLQAYTWIFTFQMKLKTGHYLTRLLHWHTCQLNWILFASIPKKYWPGDIYCQAKKRKVLKPLNNASN